MSVPTRLHVLRDRLRNGDVPGIEAHRRLAPDNRDAESIAVLPDEMRHAAVLLVLFDAQDPSVLLIRRPDDGSVHSGELAFPGGRYEAGERFPEGTALREAREEIALDPDRVLVLGTLTPLVIPVSRFRIVPVVVWADSVDYVTPDDREVAEIVPVSLQTLRNAPARRLFRTPVGDISAPCWAVSDVRPDLPPLWGASAMVAAELIDACGESC